MMNLEEMREQLAKRPDTIDAYIPKEDEKCWLDDPEIHQCCCVCKHHYPDYEHCTTNRKLRKEKDDCICNILKGYICIPPEFGGRAYSGWERHSIGCEMFERKDEKNPSPDTKTP